MLIWLSFYRTFVKGKQGLKLFRLPVLPVISAQWPGSAKQKGQCAKVMCTSSIPSSYDPACHLYVLHYCQNTYKANSKSTCLCIYSIQLMIYGFYFQWAIFIYLYMLIWLSFYRTFVKGKQGPKLFRLPLGVMTVVVFHSVAREIQ